MSPPAGSGARRLLGTALGLGRLPVAPGTWASLATALACAGLFGLEGHWQGPAAGWLDAAGLAGAGPGRLALLALLAALFLLGVRLGQHAVRDYGRADPGAFVLDEVVGQALALMLWLPGPVPLLGLAAALLLFRLFDVIKPPPCRRLEALHGGLGIMADDVAAGVYALLGAALVPL